MEEKRNEPANSTYLETPYEGEVLDADNTASAPSYKLPVKPYHETSTLEGPAHIVEQNLSTNSVVFQKPRKLFAFSQRKAIIVSAILTLVITGVTGAALLVLSRKAPQKQQTDSNFIATQDVRLKDSVAGTLPSEFTSQAESLLINGDVITRGQLKISTGDAIATFQSADNSSSQTFTLPDATGTICLDSNNCGFVTAAQIASLQQTVSDIVAGSVTSLNDQTGAITVQGTANRITATIATGVITLSTPQDIDINSSPSFSNLNISNSIIYNGRTFTLPSSGPANQQICTSAITCAVPGATAVILAPTSVQDDSTSDPSVFINDTGGGNLIQLQSGGADRFVVANNGNMTVSGDVAVNGGDITSTGALNITPGGTLTAGSTSQQFTLQGNASSSITATGGGSTTTVGFNGVPVGNVTYNFDRTVAAGTYSICSTAGNCAGVGGGVTTAGGTTNRLPIFSAAQSISDSWLLQNGTTLELDNTRNLSLLGGNFSVTGNITGSGTITFSSLTNGFLEVNGSGAVSVGTINLGTDTTGDYIQNLGTLTGLTTSGNSGEGSTPTLSVIYGAAANTAVQGNVALTCSSGTGNLTGGGNAITLGSGGTCNNIGIVNNPNFTTSVTTPTVNLGSASATTGLLNLFNSGSVNAGTLQVASLGQATTYTLPDPGAATANICLSTGNCAGSGGGVTTPGGTTNRVAKFTGSQTVGDSTITDDGTNVSLTGDLTIQGGDVTLGVASTQTGSLLFKHSGSVFTGTVLQGALTGNQTYTLPDATGTFCLSSGNCIGGGGGGAPNTAAYLTIGNDATLSNERAIAVNSTNLSFTDGGANGSYTINTIQDIATASSPTFASPIFTGTLDVQGSSITVGQASTTDGTIVFENNTNAFTSTIVVTDATANRTFTFPDASGEVSLLGQTISDAEVDDNLTISSAGSVDWTALANYPAACSAGSAVSTLADAPICTAFNTDTSITLQDAYDADVDGGDSIITLTAADDSLHFFNPSSGGSDSEYVLTVQQAATGAAKGGLVVLNNGGASSYSLRVNDDGTLTDSTPFVIDSVGNVGIGTTSNLYKVNIVQNQNVGGTIYISNTDAGTSALPGIVIDNDSGVGAGYSLFGTGGAGNATALYQDRTVIASGTDLSGIVINTEAADPIIFGVNGSEVGRFDTDGDLSVGGLTGPSARLHIYNSSASAFMRIQDATSGTSVFDGIEFGYIGADAYLYNNENSNLYLGTNGSDRISLYNTGRIDLHATSGQTINIGNSGVANTVQIGTTTGAVVQTVNIGNNATASSTANVTIGSTIGTSSLILQSGTGDVAIQSQDDINIGTNAVAQDIAIGNTTGATSLALNSGTGAITIGTSIAKAITIGNGTGSTSVSINCGTGSCGFGNNGTNHSTFLGTSFGTSGVTISSGTGDIALQSQDDINIGTNAVAQDITVGNATGATSIALNSGTGGVSVQTPGLTNAFRVNGPGGSAAAVNPVQTLYPATPTSNCCQANINMGYYFTPTRPGQISQLGVKTVAGTYTVRLYRVDGGAELASASVTATGTGSWAYTNITPVNVLPGTQYAIAVFYTSSTWYEIDNPGYPKSTGGIRIDNGAWASGAVFPTNQVNSKLYGVPDFTFTPTNISTDPIFNVDSIQGYVGIMQGSDAAQAPLHVSGGLPGTYVQDIESNLNDFVNTSPTPWTRSNSLPGGGSWSAKSGSINDSSSTTMTMTKKLAASGTISFKRKVSSESGFDYLCFYIDNSQQFCSSGEVAWGTVSYAVSAGTHTFMWTYSKDDSVFAGSDAAWIDDVTITNTFLGSTSALFDQSVGIGTSSPGARLHAVSNGTSTGYAIKVENAAGNNLISAQDNGNINIGNASTNNTIQIGSTTASTINLQTGILGAINIGDSGTGNTTIQIGNTTGAVTQTINIGNNATASSTNTVTLGSTVGTSSTAIRGGTGGITLTTSGANSNILLMSSGNVGIKTSSPQFDLTLDGNANRTIGVNGPSGNGFGANLTVRAGGGMAGDGGAGGGSLFLRGGDGSGDGSGDGGSVYLYGGNTASGGGSIGNVLLGHNGTTALGLVGIGTTSITEKLEVAGNIAPDVASTYDLGTSTLEWDELFIGDNNGIKFGLDQDATLAYDETTDDRVELTGTGASMFIEDKLGLGVQTLTLTDDGTANDTLTPTASYVRVDIDETANVGVPDLVLSETGAKDGDILMIVNNEQDATHDTFTITESAGVVHTSSSAEIGPNSSITFIYMTDRWIQLSRSDN